MAAKSTSGKKQNTHVVRKAKTLNYLCYSRQTQRSVMDRQTDGHTHTDKMK